MTHSASTPGHALPIEVLGRETCEDTAIVRSRLTATAVPFAYLDADEDPEAAPRIRSLNEGNLVTPTVVVDGGSRIAVEPTVEEVDALAAAAGQDPRLPTATQLHRPLIDVPIRLRELPGPGAPPSPARARWGNEQLALCFAHDAACLACFGYARQLARQAPGLADAGARLTFVVPGAEPPGHWSPGELGGATVLFDVDVRWRREVAEAVGAPVDGALVVLLDRYLAPRVVSSSEDAGGLIAPSEVVEWHRFIALDCPECSGELPWP